MQRLVNLEMFDVNTFENLAEERLPTASNAVRELYLAWSIICISGCPL
jgi:hypothetical protein